jgi:hypothetical protein
VATIMDRIGSATVARVEDGNELTILLRCYNNGVNRRVNNASRCPPSIAERPVGTREKSTRDYPFAEIKKEILLGLLYM